MLWLLEWVAFLWAWSVWVTVPAVFVFGAVTYVRWQEAGEPGENFAKGYWYTDRNPLHRTWWPLIYLLAYMATVPLLVIAGLLE